jgi:hypothetical protein
MSASAQLDLAQLHIADTVSSGKGKSAQISGNGQPVYWQPGVLPVAFEAGNFSKEPASRVNMVFRATQIQEALNALDAFVVAYVAQHSDRILGKPMSLADVQKVYQPCLKRSDKYDPTFKCKINVEAPNQVRLWDGNKQPRKPPASWKGLAVSPRLRLKALWLMGCNFGCLWEATDLMFDEQPAQSIECPF